MPSPSHPIPQKEKKRWGGGVTRCVMLDWEGWGMVGDLYVWTHMRVWYWGLVSRIIMIHPKFVNNVRMLEVWIMNLVAQKCKKLDLYLRVFR